MFILFGTLWEVLSKKLCSHEVTIWIVRRMLFIVHSNPKLNPSMNLPWLKSAVRSPRPKFCFLQNNYTHNSRSDC